MSRPRGSAATKRLRSAIQLGNLGPAMTFTITASSPTLPRDRLPEQIFREGCRRAVAKKRSGGRPRATT